MLQRFGYKDAVKFSSVYSPTPVRAATFVRKMRGHSQSLLLWGTDGGLYVVKPRGNPFNSGSVANDLIGAGLCQTLGFPVPQSHLVQIDGDFLERHPDAWFETPQGPLRPPAGLHYGAAFAGSVRGPGRPFEIIHGTLLNAVRNRDHFCGMYLFDIWANHLDCRQSLYLSDGGRKNIHAVFLDNGMLFGGKSWCVTNTSLQAQYRRRDAVNVLWRNDVVNTWLERFRTVIPGALAHALKLVPPEWCAGDPGSLQQALLQRLSSIEQLVSPYV